MRAAQLRQLFFLIIVTVIYLTFELGFNARLLDVVGGGASPDDIERLETYGRTLSGVAAALVVLQILLGKRLKAGWHPHYFVIALACLLTGWLVFSSIKLVVDGLVATRDNEFRRVAASSSLLQRSLVRGDLQLDGLADDGVFARPEGKAFLALFQVLLSNVDNLDAKVEAKKRQVIRADFQRQHIHATIDGRAFVSKEPGMRGYYEAYGEAMGRLTEQWRKYAGIPVASDEGLLREQSRAWNDYRNRLSQRRWTPDTVPARYKSRVVQDVRKRVAVPADWDPADRATFLDAVARQYWRTAASRGVTVDGDTIAPGLGYEAFVARPGVQRKLRAALHVPPSVAVATAYDVPGFKRFYDSMLDHAVETALPFYSAKAEEFGPGGKHYELANDAARAAIVPPVALLCSLLGAVGHFAKLLYLLVKLVVWLRVPAGQKPSPFATRAAGVALAGTVISVWVLFSFMQNDVTRSELFRSMAQGGGASSETAAQAVQRRVLANIAHVVAVGQAYTYPFNEGVRKHVLQGLRYGYHEEN